MQQERLSYGVVTGCKGRSGIVPSACQLPGPSCCFTHSDSAHCMLTLAFSSGVLEPYQLQQILAFLCRLCVCAQQSGAQEPQVYQGPGSWQRGKGLWRASTDACPARWEPRGHKRGLHG